MTKLMEKQKFKQTEIGHCKVFDNDFSMVMNKEIQIVEPTAERIDIKDEWDTQEICKVFEEKKRVMVRAVYAGSGKSYAASYMEKLGHKVLFVCPTNKLAINNKGITIKKIIWVWNDR